MAVRADLFQSPDYYLLDELLTDERLASVSSDRGSCAGARNEKDGAACAAPWLRSGGCARA